MGFFIYIGIFSMIIFICEGEVYSLHSSTPSASQSPVKCDGKDVIQNFEMKISVSGIIVVDKVVYLCLLFSMKKCTSLEPRRSRHK